MRQALLARPEELSQLIDRLKCSIAPVATTIELSAILDAKTRPLLDLAIRRRAIASCEHAACQGIVDHHADVMLLAEWQQLVFDHAKKDVVAWLHADKAGQVIQLARPVRIG